jgi:hypothetical protein
MFSVSANTRVLCFECMCDSLAPEPADRFYMYSVLKWLSFTSLFLVNTNIIAPKDRGGLPKHKMTIFSIASLGILINSSNLWRSRPQIKVHRYVPWVPKSEMSIL